MVLNFISSFILLIVRKVTFCHLIFCEENIFLNIAEG